MDRKTGTERAASFVDGVLSGDIEAPVLVHSACERFRNDLKRDDIYLDVRAADAAVRNMELFKHVKGKWRGQPLQLEPWQCFIVVSIFGWKRSSDDLRRFRSAYVQLPRKQGKTLLAVGIALLMLGPDQEPAPEIYLGATGQEQARDLLFKPAKEIVNACPEYREAFGVKVNATSIVTPDHGGVLKSVIRKPDDGQNPHMGVVDEYHLHSTDEQFSVFQTGMGARSQPLLLVCTTAGFQLGTPCHNYRDEVAKIVRGTVTDDTVFGLIYELDPGERWDTMEAVRKVNPNIGVSVSEDYLETQLNRARRSAEAQAAFRTKHLNEWLGSKQNYISMVAWRRQGNESLRLKDFRGMSCHVAIDLSTQKDIASLAAVFKQGQAYYAFCKHWVPEGACEWNDRYRNFALGGHLEITDGNAQDFALIEEYIKRLGQDHRVIAARFDPWQSAEMMQRLQKTGLPVYKVSQQFSSFSDPTKHLETLVLDGQFWHQGPTDPVLTWQLGNTALKMNPDGHVKPVKENHDNPLCKIDGIVAVIMALKGWLEEPESEVVIRYA